MISTRAEHLENLLRDNTSSLLSIENDCFTVGSPDNSKNAFRNLFYSPENSLVSEDDSDVKLFIRASRIEAVLPGLFLSAFFH